MEILHLINTITISIYTILLLFIWKKSKLDGFIILILISWFTLMGRIIYIDQLPLWTSLITFTFLISALILMKYAYEDKLYTFVALYVFTFFVLTILVFNTTWNSNGELAILSTIYLYLWYKATPRCFNPFTCKIYNIDKL